MVRKELLDELKIIVLEDYGLELSDQRISAIGNSLVDIFKILLNEKGEECEKEKKK